MVLKRRKGKLEERKRNSGHKTVSIINRRNSLTHLTNTRELAKHISTLKPSVGKLTHLKPQPLTSLHFLRKNLRLTNPLPAMNLKRTQKFLFDSIMLNLHPIIGVTMLPGSST